MTAVGAERIVQAVRLEGASSSVGIGRGIRIVRIRAQFAEVFRVDGEREEEDEKDKPRGEPPTSGTTGWISLLLAWRVAQAGWKRFLTPFQLSVLGE